MPLEANSSDLKTTTNSLHSYQISPLLLQAIVFFHLAVSTVLLTTTPSNGKQLRHVSSSESSHLDNVNELFSTKSKKKKATATGRRKVQLFCRTGFLLEILDNGEVAGTHNESSIYSKSVFIAGLPFTIS